MAQSLEDVISGIVKARFADAEIEDITYESDFDSDGDPILRITVVFASELAAVDPHKLAGLVRQVRPSLNERREARFPIFRFVSKRDNDRMRHEAA